MLVEVGRAGPNIPSDCPRVGSWLQDDDDISLMLGLLIAGDGGWGNGRRYAAEHDRRHEQHGDERGQQRPQATKRHDRSPILLTTSAARSLRRGRVETLTLYRLLLL